MFEETGVLKTTQRKVPDMKTNKLAHRFSNTSIKLLSMTTLERTEVP
jgi:hypothetical protein